MIKMSLVLTSPKLPIINNVVDCPTQTSKNKSLCSYLFIKKDLFENFYNKYLEFKYYAKSKFDENQVLKNEINHLL